jgi:hypothetical protein
VEDDRRKIDDDGESAMRQPPKCGSQSIDGFGGLLEARRKMCRCADGSAGAIDHLMTCGDRREDNGAGEPIAARVRVGATGYLNHLLNLSHLQSSGEMHVSSTDCHTAMSVSFLSILSF